MAPRSPVSSARGPRIKGNARQPPDDEIDYSDIPEFTDEQLREFRPVGRPPVGDAVKKSIAIRINPNLLAKLRSMAARKHIPYQTLIHDILERSVARASRREASRR